MAPGDAVQTGDVLVRMSGSDETGAPVDEDRPSPRPKRTRRGSCAPSWPSFGPRWPPRSIRDGPHATERRHARGRRTARENIADLCDPGSFEEYGGLVIAAQRARRSTDDLIAQHPGRRARGRHRASQRRPLRPERSRCAVLSYDYTVLAGTQGQMQPPQEGSPLRARRAAAAAGGPLRRRRRRAARATPTWRS